MDGLANISAESCCASPRVVEMTAEREVTDAWVRRLVPDDPIFILRPEIIARNVERFRDQLDAEILYAVKCNPDKAVLTAMHDAGITRFDTASLPEIQMVKSLSRELECHFHHPIKSRRSVRESASSYDVCHFTIDSREELEKIRETLEPSGNTLHIRVAVPSGSGCCGSIDKFGATESETLQLLQEASAMGFELGLSFHVGSQCRDPGRYIAGLNTVANIIDRTNVEIDWINCGGGFPIDAGASEGLLLHAIFDALSDRLRDLRNRTGARILVEPGRALVATAISLIVRVNQRKARKLYLNDGIYGALSKGCCGCESVFSVRAISAVGGELADFSIFGPTCDSTDKLDARWLLPDGISEGDWIEVTTMGAYAGTLATRFNGFHQHSVVTIGEIDHFSD